MLVRIKKAIAGLAVALLASVGLVAVTSSPAAAAYGDCPNDEVCIFDNANGGGFMYRFGPSLAGSCVNNGRHATTSSATNRKSGTRVKFYSAPDCWLPGQGVVSTWVYYGGNVNMGLMNDNMYSFRWEYCTGCPT